MSEEAAVATEEEKDAPEAVKLEGKMAEFVDWIETISVLELSQLVKALETRLGVSAAAPAMAMVAAGPGAGDGAEAEAEAEQTEFSVILTETGGQKIQVIKEIRAATSLGLKEAKALADEPPKPIKEGISKEEAEELKAKLEAAGATVEIK
jgi:large subunit ribosomal protein L7/L12